MPQRKLTTYQAVISQARAFRVLRSFMTDVLQKYDITMTEWLMIGSALDKGAEGIRVSELAKTLGVEMPVITNLVHKAVAGGWVTSAIDTDDKRAKKIAVTEYCIEQACAIEGELLEGTKSWLDGVDKHMLKGYFEVVDALARKYN